MKSRNRRKNSVRGREPPLILLDANFIISLAKRHLLDKVLLAGDGCFATTQVVIKEAEFYYERGLRYNIDLQPYVRNGLLQVVDVKDLKEYEIMKDLESIFGIHEGEKALLAIAINHRYMLATYDKNAGKYFLSKMPRRYLMTLRKIRQKFNL